MSKDFKKVTRYECVWCGKLFKTNTKHACKFSPERHNCFSCKHCLGWQDGQDFGPDGDTFGPYFLCAKGRDDGGSDVSDIAYNGWDGVCADWELRDNYKGSDTWALIRTLQRDKGMLEQAIKEMNKAGYVDVDGLDRFCVNEIRKRIDETNKKLLG